MRVRIKIIHEGREYAAWVGDTDSADFNFFFNGFLEEGTKVVIERCEIQ